MMVMAAQTETPNFKMELISFFIPLLLFRAGVSLCAVGAYYRRVIAAISWSIMVWRYYDTLVLVRALVILLPLPSPSSSVVVAMSQKRRVERMKRWFRLNY